MCRKTKERKEQKKMKQNERKNANKRKLTKKEKAKKEWIEAILGGVCVFGMIALLYFGLVLFF